MSDHKQKPKSKKNVATEGMIGIWSRHAGANF